MISEEDAELGNPMEGFRDGDIIVAAMINPAWLPYFSRAGGFVSEVGGWLSHPAILAREYDVAMIVGTEGIGRIADGDRLRLQSRWQDRGRGGGGDRPRRGRVAAVRASHAKPGAAFGRRLFIPGRSPARRSPWRPSHVRPASGKLSQVRSFNPLRPLARRSGSVVSATIGIIANARIAAVLGQPIRTKSKVIVVLPDLHLRCAAV